MYTCDIVRLNTSYLRNYNFHTRQCKQFWTFFDLKSIPILLFLTLFLKHFSIWLKSANIFLYLFHFPIEWMIIFKIFYNWQKKIWSKGEPNHKIFFFPALFRHLRLQDLYAHFILTGFVREIKWKKLYIFFPSSIWTKCI